MWWKRYEPLLEQKPVSTREALLDLLARELAEICLSFPPAEEAMDWHDPALARRFKGRLAELPAPDHALIALLAEIIALDLDHEAEAIDHMLRNDLHRAACPSARHVDALHLLWRALVEQLLARKEESAIGLKRRDLVEVARRLPAAFRREQARRVGLVV